MVLDSVFISGLRHLEYLKVILVIVRLILLKVVRRDIIAFCCRCDHITRATSDFNIRAKSVPVPQNNLNQISIF